MLRDLKGSRVGHCDAVVCIMVKQAVISLFFRRAPLSSCRKKQTPFHTGRVHALVAATSRCCHVHISTNGLPMDSRVSYMHSCVLCPCYPPPPPDHSNLPTTPCPCICPSIHAFVLPSSTQSNTIGRNKYHPGWKCRKCWKCRLKVTYA